MRGHGLFVSGLGPLKIDYETLATLFAHSTVTEDLASIGIGSAEELLGHLLMDSEHIRSYLSAQKAHATNTDDNAYLEYRTPFEFLGSTKDIIRVLKPFAGWDGDAILVNAPQEVRRKVRESFAKRLGRLLHELDEPIE